MTGTQRWIVSLSVAVTVVGVSGVSNASVIAPFGTCGWKYAAGLSGSTPSLSALSVSDSQWATGCMPFAAAWCPSTGTAMPANKRMIVRWHIFNPGLVTNLQYRVRGSWQINTAWNGNDGNGGNLANECPAPSEFTGLFPLSSGDNVFLVDVTPTETAQGDHYGGQLDVELSTDGLTELNLRSWGSLKITYR